jgi:uncharacterized membrane protein
VFVAPGFSFMAGFMIAVTSLSREERGRTDVTGKLITRGIVLIVAEALVFSLPFLAFHFEVLSCLGVCIVATALLRRVPQVPLAVVALAVLALHPLLGTATDSRLGFLPEWLRMILHEPAPYPPGHRFGVLYPVIPWVGLMLLGLVVGRDAKARERPERLWAGLGLASLGLFFAVRLAQGYGNTWPHGGIGTYAFWTFAKYPPDLAWITFSLGVIFLLLAGLRAAQGHPAMGLLAPVRGIGRVPFFFYLVHFIVLFASTFFFARDARGHVPWGLWPAVGVWLLLWAAMLGPCRWYFRMKTERPNVVTRYL